MRVKFGANEIIIVPERRIALFRAPLVIAENHHRDRWPFLAADRAHLRHRDAERTITGKAYDRNIRIADFRADNRREPVTARPEQARCQIFPAFLEGRIRIADCAIIPDIG